MTTGGEASRNIPREAGRDYRNRRQYQLIYIGPGFYDLYSGGDMSTTSPDKGANSELDVDASLKN